MDVPLENPMIASILERDEEDQRRRSPGGQVTHARERGSAGPSVG